ncbi:uncharacterized protein LOC122255266 isoform X2 [Penaeus japonicus]|uniref:uncharacterized protein LOC122255266 isoform X2 n=1 Tax=Penaeus japonicus TaxID=27405 RepID=UPI001C70B738|nr:uncharacterized protein LOC122255266 isoform X2 [Penaeus japonicus]
MQEDQRNSRDWCAIWGTILSSTCLVCMGFVLLVDGVDDNDTAGYSLVFAGGILLAVSILAALGKRRLNRTNSQAIRYDPPPSYRRSWRGAFLSRTTDHEVIFRNRQEENGTSNQAVDIQDGQTATILSSHFVPTIALTESPRNHTSSRTSPMPVTPAVGRLAAEEGGVGVNTLRQSQSLSSVFDPPCYEFAVANMDEGSLRKLKSEVDISSLPHIAEVAGDVK